jgi:predicted peptidase
MRFLIIVLLLAGCTRQKFDFDDSGTGFVMKSVQFRGENRKYCLYVPENYHNRTKWPLILFFHGSGERGLDGKKPCKVGLGLSVLNNPSYFPCLVLMPQESEDLENPWEPALEQTLEDYSIDSSRIYLTGISVGGTAVWIAAERYPERFAALMPVCGRSHPEGIGCYLDKPVWIFHGTDDKIIPVVESRLMYRLIHENGGDARYTEFPNAGHECWDKVYQDEEVIEWLLGCR